MDIFYYLHGVFLDAISLPLLLTSAALVPKFKEIEKSIYCTFSEVPTVYPKTGHKSEEEGNEIIYFRRFKRVVFFGVVDGDDCFTPTS